VTRRRKRKRVVLAVIDGLRPEMLDAAIEDGRAPALAHLREQGVYVDDCVAAFPSVTPVCTSSIMTGAGPAEHGVPGMNWYHRGEGRYVEYGSSFAASRACGLGRSLIDLIFNLNLSHLSRDTPTVYERLDDAGLRTAGTTFMITRGRHRHQPAEGESALARLVGSTLIRHGLWGPREFFYADLFATRRTGCRSQLGMPGARDAHAGCVGAHLVEHDLFDFLLLSLPDNDSHSHRAGPEGQIVSAELADRQLERLMHAGGGPEAFLEDHFVIVLADHAHALVEDRIPLRLALSDARIQTPDDPRPEEAELAISPGQRFAMVYALDDERRHELVTAAVGAVTSLDGVDLTIWRDGNEAVVHSARGELRFAPGEEVSDRRGGRWTVSGEPATLSAQIADGAFDSEEYPDALGRIWSALGCPNAGEVLMSAAPGFEFIDWGGSDHMGGGSHGSLHRSDSLGPLLWCGGGPASRDEHAQWTLRDVAPMVTTHFGV